MDQPIPPSPIDVSFDFTTDTPGYWDGFWERNDGLGLGKRDPDSCSPMLRKYHRILWSRELPCGRSMDLREVGDHLEWDGHRFSSDSITASFRYKKNRAFMTRAMEEIPDYRSFMEDFIRRSYTIGGTIIFPKRTQGINPSRGTNRLISDRWDMTLECIRRHYAGEESPLSSVLEKDSWFFDLFVDFRGYVEYFLLQDCVTDDFGKVVFWMGDGSFKANDYPTDVPTYIDWISKNLDFVNHRNRRIEILRKELSYGGPVRPMTLDDYCRT